jgi:hypothetical protein
LNAYLYPTTYSHLLSRLSLFAVAYCCLEDESTRKEAAGEARAARRGASESSQGIPEEGAKSNQGPQRVPKSCGIGLNPNILCLLVSVLFSATPLDL